MRHRPARVNAPISIIACLATVLLASMASVPAHAQQDPGIEIKGFGSVGYMFSIQDTDVVGSSFDDGHGLEANLGFSTGNVFTWLLGYELVTADDYTTHFIPVKVRAYDPWRLFAEDAELPFGIRTFAEVGLGLFFSQVSGKFTTFGSSEDNERAAAWRVGGGVEMGLTETLSGYVDAGYVQGLGGVDDYKYGTVGIGVVYRWEL